MKFIVKKWTRFPEDYNCVQGPCVLLLENNWDDFGYRTSYGVYFKPPTGDQLINLEGVKILHQTQKTTVLPLEFDYLSSEYCSLGSSMDYYEKLSKLGSEVYNEILKSLNDVAIYEEIKSKFISHVGFNESLLRNGTNALHNARSLLNETDILSRYTFTYSTKLNGAINNHCVNFEFYRNDGIPYRVTAIIGKNGTGKTRYLADLASDLTTDFKLKQEKFVAGRPDFGMVLSLSYSAFTMFNKKTENDANNIMYKNFGVLDNSNLFSPELMETNLSESIKRIIEFKRVEFWIETLRDLQSDEFVDYILKTIVEKDDFSRLSQLSSGQRMIFEIITNIVANIRINTLVIFDEPEIHLHPNAIAKLMKALYAVLEEYDSFAILATHVPHVIQQIPSKSVVIFERIANSAIVKPLNFESFGENLSEITIGIFETNNVFDNYKNVLKKLSASYGYEEVLELFDHKLSLNARIFLKNCYEEDGI